MFDTFYTICWMVHIQIRNSIIKFHFSVQLQVLCFRALEFAKSDLHSYLPFHVIFTFTKLPHFFTKWLPQPFLPSRQMQAFWEIILKSILWMSKNYFFAVKGGKTCVLLYYFVLIIFTINQTQKKRVQKTRSNGWNQFVLFFFVV